MHRSGVACANAPITKSAARWQVLVRPLTAAGCVAFIIVPSGAATVIGRASPEFDKIVGSDHRLYRVIDARQQRRIDHVDPGPDLGRALESELHLVAGYRDFDRYWERAAEFGIVIGVRETIGAIRQCRDPGAHLALGIVLKGV